MILVVGSVVVKGEHLDEALELSQLHVERSRTEPGCLVHGVLQDTENPLRLVYVEKWQDRSALAKHFEVRESIDFVKAIARLSAEAPQIEIFDAKAVSL